MYRSITQSFYKLHVWLCLIVAMFALIGTESCVYAQDILDLTQVQNELEAKQAELDAFEPMLL
ncbi:hypothetical protein KAR10_10350, partial [bacterium]|nr:hypothetical protein [bacterium]